MAVDPNDQLGRYYSCFTHQDEYHKVQDDVEGSAPYEKLIDIEASSLHIRINSVPCIVHRSTTFLQSMVDLMGKICIPLEHDCNVNANHVHNAHHGDPDEDTPKPHRREDAVIECQTEPTLAMLTQRSIVALTWTTSIAWSLCGRRG